MVTQFNKKDMFSFGKYLISREREESLEETDKLAEKEEGCDQLPYEERKRIVFDVDFQNWKLGRKRNGAFPANELQHKLVLARRDYFEKGMFVKKYKGILIMYNIYTGIRSDLDLHTEDLVATDWTSMNVMDWKGELNFDKK